MTSQLTSVRSTDTVARADAPGLRHGFAAKWHRRRGSFDGEIRDIRLNRAVWRRNGHRLFRIRAAGGHSAWELPHLCGGLYANRTGVRTGRLEPNAFDGCMQVRVIGDPLLPAGSAMRARRARRPGSGPVSLAPVGGRANLRLGSARSRDTQFGSPLVLAAESTQTGWSVKDEIDSRPWLRRARPRVPVNRGSSG